MRFQFLSVITALSFMTCPAVLADEHPSLLPRCGQTAFDLCGFIDADIWEKEDRSVLVIEPKFEVAKRFSEGLAAVRVEGKFGYIDRSGAIVIEPQFEQAGKFDQGLAVAGSEGAFGIIDRSGDYVVDPLFLQALIFNNQTILAVPTENQNRGWAIPYDFSIHEAGIYHITNGWLTEPKYYFTRFDSTKREVIWAQEPRGETGTWDDFFGLMQADGRWLIEPQYTFGTELKNNRALVRKRIDGEIVSGAIDGKGNEVIPFVFDYLTHWNDGFLLAGDYENRKFGLVTQDGELLAGRYFDEIERPDRMSGPKFPERDYYPVRDGEEWKSLFKDGTLLKDQRVGTTYLECEQFQISYVLNGYELKPQDSALPTILFDRPLFPYTNRLCAPPPTLILGETYAQVTENGAVFGGFFENNKNFFGTHLWVSVNRKWGLVDGAGKFAVEPIYDLVEHENGYGLLRDLPSDTTNDTYKVSIGDEVYRLRFVDGAYKQEPYSEPEENRSRVLTCKGGLKIKSKDGLWGIVDQKGDDVIPAKYRAISCFNSGVALAPDDARSKWCPIDRYGNHRSAPACSDSYYPTGASHHDPEKFHEDPYESNVLWMRAWLDYGEGRRNEQPKLVPW